MGLSIPEFDDWAKKHLSSIVKKEPLKFIDHNNENIKYVVNVNSFFDIEIKGAKGYDHDSPIIKSGVAPANVKLTGNLSIVTPQHANKKIEVRKKYFNKVKKIPDLNITTRDINLASMYLSNRSNLPEFEKDIKRISLVAPTTPEELAKGMGTLFVRKLSNGKFILKYNPQFIAECIVEDYIYSLADLPGYEKYNGAFTSLCYLIGHELMHYRNNHFAPHMHDTIKKILYPTKFKAPHEDDTSEESDTRPRVDSVQDKRSIGKKIIDSIVGQEAEKFTELQNNSHMSNILDIGAVNMGMGRSFIKKSNNYSGLYSGYLKLNARDKDINGKTVHDVLSKFSADRAKELSKSGWAFTDVEVIAVTKIVKMDTLLNRQDPDVWSGRDKEEIDKDIIWPYTTPYPSDNDIQKFLMLVFLTYLPVSKETANKKVEPIDGYQIGDQVVIKKTKKRGVITAISGDEITITPDEVGLQDEILHILPKESYNDKLDKNEPVRDIFRKHGLSTSYILSKIKENISKFSDPELKVILKAINSISKDVKDGN